MPLSRTFCSPRKKQNSEYAELDVREGGKGLTFLHIPASCAYVDLAILVCVVYVRALVRLVFWETNLFV